MFSDPSRICKEKCKRTCLRRKKKMFWHYLCWERKNINHLAENSFQRNLGVPEGPSNESPVSIWTFQGLSKANWKAKPWESSSPAFAPPRPPHPARLALVFFESIGKCWHLAFYWVANLDFDIRPDRSDSWLAAHARFLWARTKFFPLEHDGFLECSFQVVPAWRSLWVYWRWTVSHHDKHVCSLFWRKLSASSGCFMEIVIFLWFPL